MNEPPQRSLAGKWDVLTSVFLSSYFEFQIPRVWGGGEEREEIQRLPVQTTHREMHDFCLKSKVKYFSTELRLNLALLA